MLSQQLLENCSLAASEGDLGGREATALSSLIYRPYSVVTALASLLVANKGTIYGADASERSFVYLHLTQLNSKKQQRMNFMTEALLMSIILEQKLCSFKDWIEKIYLSLRFVILLLLQQSKLEKFALFVSDTESI